MGKKFDLWVVAKKNKRKCREMRIAKDEDIAVLVFIKIKKHK